MSDLGSCVRLGYGIDEKGVAHPEHGNTWCGRTRADIKYEWTYEDPTHALLDQRNGGRLGICRACADAMKKVIDHWAPGVQGNRGEAVNDFFRRCR